MIRIFSAQLWLWLLCTLLLGRTLGSQSSLEIKELDLVHFSHTDVGFTDHPAVCRELYRRYLDVALDAVSGSGRSREGARFCWTAEATMPVNDWWQKASPERRKLFLRAVASGQLEIAALPFNNTPFMDAHQWDTMLHWLPEDLWKKARPKVAVQNDVNGLPRAAALRLLDRGIHRLFTGINEDSGGVPFPRPSAFWWKMPDGRKLFVWLNIGYGSGFDFFEPQEWRRGPVPLAADAHYRPPRAEDILRTDEASLRAAHQLCCERLRQIQQQGYHHPLLAISITSQWRFDNDPPFPPLADFVAAWNRLGLKPSLRLTTVSATMERLERMLGPTAPEYSGEWTDWWANGTASAPREVAASRAAKRYLAAAQSPLWGPLPPTARQTIDEIYRELCLFDEHTWGSSLSVAQPYSLDTQGQFNEKAGLAFRSMARAEWLLSQRARTLLSPEGEGLLVANPFDRPYSGWATMIATCLRDNYRSVEDVSTGQAWPITFEPGIQPWGRPQTPADLSKEDISATFPDRAPDKLARFWINNLPGKSIRHLRLSTKKLPMDAARSVPSPEIKTTDSGWPASAAWPGMTSSLFLEGLGDFTAIKVNAFAPRWTLADIRGKQGPEREALRKKLLEEVPATAEGKAEVKQTAHTILYTQSIQHPRLQWGTRTLEIWKGEPRARLTLRINRLSSAAPEIFYVAFPLPVDKTLPRLSSGGQSFTPFTDQLPGTCRDYFAIDGWAEYATPKGNWLWVSRDAPLITFGRSATLSLRQEPPEDVSVLMAMIFNNFWYTNFVADSHGIMEFQFDLVWRAEGDSGGATDPNGLVLEPIVVINPALPEDPTIAKRLFQP